MGWKYGQEEELPFNGVLSSNNLPKKINRMLLGLLGCVSHSSLHSLNINSFRVYTLMLNGSFLPPSVIPGTSTFRLIKYLSSILYGCLAPDANNNVMTRTGPASLIAGVGVFSADGVIGTESSRVLPGLAADEGSDASAAAVFVAASFVEEDRA